MSAPEHSGKIKIAPELDRDQHRDLALSGVMLPLESIATGSRIVYVAQAPYIEKEETATAEELVVSAIEDIGVEGYARLKYETPEGETVNDIPNIMGEDGWLHNLHRGRTSRVSSEGERVKMFSNEARVGSAKLAFVLSGEEYEVEVPAEVVPEKRKFRIFSALGS